MQRRWQLLELADYVRAALLEPAATPACSWARGAEWGAFVEGKCTVPAGSRDIPEGFGSLPAQMLPSAELSCLSLHTPELLDAAPGCDWWQNITPAIEREKESKAHTRNIQWTNPQAIDLGPEQLLILQWTASLQVKLKCVQGSALILIHSHQKASQCWYEDINYFNHYLTYFSHKPMYSLWVFSHLLHQVSHDQVMCVFLQCHLSAPDQCSNSSSVIHIFCATLIGQGGLGHLAVLRGHCFYLLLLLYTRDQTFSTVISPHQCLQKLTKTMLNPPVKTRGKQKFRRELLSPNTLSRPVKGTVCRELWNQRGNTGWPGFIPMTWTPWHFWQLDTKVNTITPTGPFWAASSQQLWRAHTRGQHRNHWPRNSACTGYFAGLREDAMGSWQSCTPTGHLWYMKRDPSVLLRYVLPEQLWSGTAVGVPAAKPSGSDHVPLGRALGDTKASATPAVCKRGHQHTFQEVLGAD